MCTALVSRSEGAYLPSGMAPPPPVMPWQAEQLARKSAPPRAMSSSERSAVYCDSSGMAGPAPSDAT